MSVVLPFGTMGLPPRTTNTQGQGEENTARLLSFVDMASSNIKLALDKPVKSKRRVNHRKYLQKQLKRCGSGNKGRGDVSSECTILEVPASVGMANANATGTGSGKFQKKESTQLGLQSKSLQALFDPRTLHERCCADPNPRSASHKVPLRKRNLPASFFTEPVYNRYSGYGSENHACCHGKSLHQQNFQPSYVSQEGQHHCHHHQQQQQQQHVNPGGGNFEPVFENPELTEILSEAWQQSENGRASTGTTPSSTAPSPAAPELLPPENPLGRAEHLGAGSGSRAAEETLAPGQHLPRAEHLQRPEPHEAPVTSAPVPVQTVSASASVCGLANLNPSPCPSWSPGSYTDSTSPFDTTHHTSTPGETPVPFSHHQTQQNTACSIASNPRNLNIHSSLHLSLPNRSVVSNETHLQPQVLVREGIIRQTVSSKPEARNPVVQQSTPSPQLQVQGQQHPEQGNLRNQGQGTVYLNEPRQEHTQSTVNQYPGVIQGPYHSGYTNPLSIQVPKQNYNLHVDLNGYDTSAAETIPCAYPHAPEVLPSQDGYAGSAGNYYGAQMYPLWPSSGGYAGYNPRTVPVPTNQTCYSYL